MVRRAPYAANDVIHPAADGAIASQPGGWGDGVTGVHTDRTIPENLVKIGLVVSEISLLQAIVKK